MYLIQNKNDKYSWPDKNFLISESIDGNIFKAKFHNRDKSGNLWYIVYARIFVSEVKQTFLGVFVDEIYQFKRVTMKS